MTTTRLPNSEIWRSPVSRTQYHVAARACSAFVDGQPRKALNLGFCLPAGGGLSNFNLHVPLADIAALLATVAQLPEGPRLLAEALTAATSRQQEHLRALAEGIREAFAQADGADSAGDDHEERFDKLWLLLDDLQEMAADLLEDEAVPLPLPSV